MATKDWKKIGEILGGPAPTPTTGFEPALNVPKAVANDLPYSSPEGELVYTTDAWSREQFDTQVRSDGALTPVVKRVGARHQLLHREVFGRLYGLGARRLPDEAIDDSAIGWAPKLHDEAAGLPEWKEMEAAADGDPLLCGIATARVGAVLNELLPADLPASESDTRAQLEAVDSILEQRGRSGRSKKGKSQLAGLRAKLAARLAAGVEQRSRVEESISQKMPLIRSKLRSACKVASQEIAEAAAAREMVNLLGPGTGMGAAESVRRDKLLSNDRVRRVLALAGRFKHEISKRRKVGGSGREEIHSVELGADVDRLLPVELSMLGAPMGAELLLGKLADRRALQYAMRGRQKQTKGPILIAIDESGSMRGIRDEWAKAVALSLMWLAQKEGRAFGVLHFSGSVGRTDLFGSARAVMLEQLVDVVSHFENGGTSIAEALTVAVDIIGVGSMPTGDGASVSWQASDVSRELRKSDVIVISDGDDSSMVHTPCDKLESLGASVYGIGIGASFHPWFKKHLEDEVVLEQAEIERGILPDVLLKV